MWPSGKLPFECQKIDISFKKIDKIVIFQQNCHWQFCWKNDNFWQFFWKECQVFGNFLTFKWQFSGGSALGMASDNGTGLSIITAKEVNIVSTKQILEHFLQNKHNSIWRYEKNKSLTFWNCYRFKMIAKTIESMKKSQIYQYISVSMWHLK